MKNKIFSRFLKNVGVAFAALICMNTHGRAQGTWVPLAHTSPSASGGVMLLLTDGTVLLKTTAGGGQGKIWCKLTPDASGSYVNGTWTTMAAMANDRLYFSSEVLRDGRVYVCGGEYGAGGSAGEVYNPVTNSWTACPLTGYFVSDANSEMLPDGRVLQACVGGGTRHTKLWDPATNTYSAGPDCLRTDNEAPWLKLPDSSILFIDNYSTSSERYEPTTNTWITDGSVPVNVYDPYGDEAGNAELLPDGRGFFIGSSGHNAYYTPSGSTAVGSWAAGPDIPGSHGTPDAPSAMMVNGKILMSVSPIPTSSNHFPSPTTFYEFDYTTNTFTSISAPGGSASLPVPCYVTNMLDLPNGTVLFAEQGSSQLYEYVPTGSPLAAGQPTVSNIFKVNCDTFIATGTLFNGISEGAGYGDDWQCFTNYPIIRLTSGSNVYYTRTFNWNSTGVMRGTKPDTTFFALPAGLPAGSYSLEVVANGIASAGFSFNPDFTNSPTAASVCAGLTTTITNPWSGGSWSSADATIASVGSTGIVLGVASGTTTITYNVGGCTSLTTVTVNTAAPPISPSGGAQVCMGSSTTLSDGTPGGSWSTSSSGIANIDAFGTVTGISSGTATITYTLGICYATEPVTVNALPVASATPGGPTTFCIGDNVVLSGTSGTGYTYQWQVAGGDIPGATTMSYTATASGSYEVIVTTPQGCAALSPAVVVTVNTPPAATITPSGPTTFCAGDNVTLNANPGAGLTYQWQQGGFAIGGATSINYVATSGGNYTVVITDGATGCNATSAGTVITVNPLPSAISGVPTVCAGSTTSLTSSPSGGTWTSSNTTVATVSSTGVVTGLGTGGMSTISYTLGTGCSISTIVTVNSSVAAPVSGPSSVCASQSIALSDGTPGGSWSSSSTSVATVSSSGVVTGVTSGVATISYLVSTACGTATVTKPITVNATPVVASITGATTICPGTTSHLSDATPGGVWNSSNPAVGTISAGGIVTGITLGATTISYSVTNILGCTTDVTTSFTVFNPLTSTASSAGPTTFCTGGFVVLNADTAPGLSYQWENGGTVIAGATSATYTARSTGNYTVVISNSAGCSSASAPISVSVNPAPIVAPTVDISASPDTIICVVTSPVTFATSGTHTGTSPSYQWYVNSVAISGSTSFTYSPASGDRVKVVMISSDICAFPATAADSVNMTISPLRTPGVTIVSNPTTICQGDTIKFSAVPVWGGAAPTFLWTRNGINVATGPDYLYIPSNGDVLVCTMTTDYPCVTTNVVSSPVFRVTSIANLTNAISISVSQPSVVAGHTVVFTAVAPNAGGSASYQWLINGLPVPGATTTVYNTDSLRNGQVVTCRESTNAPCVGPSTVVSAGIKMVVSPNGVQQLYGATDGFSLLPNPNKGDFTISGTINETAGDVAIVVTDMLGQTVHRETVQISGSSFSQHIMLDQSLASGIYLVTVTSGSNHAVFHMVLAK